MKRQLRVMFGSRGPGCNRFHAVERSRATLRRSHSHQVSPETEVAHFSRMASPGRLMEIEAGAEFEDQPVAAPNATASRRQASRNGYEAGRWSTIRRTEVTTWTPSLISCSRSVQT